MPHDPFNLLERNFTLVLKASNNVTYIFKNLTTERARMNYITKTHKCRQNNNEGRKGSYVNTLK